MPEPKKGPQFRLWWLILVGPKLFLTFILELLNMVKNTKAIYISHYKVNEYLSFASKPNQNPMRFFLLVNLDNPKRRKMERNQLQVTT
jgi:hypothetical protein